MSSDAASALNALRGLELRVGTLAERMEGRLVPLEKDMGLLREDLRLIRRDLAELHRMLCILLADVTPPMGVKTGQGG